MKLEFLFVGKTSEKYLEQGIEIYIKRINQYLKASISVVASTGHSTDKKKALKKESEAVMKRITDKDFIILLDEKGKEYDSVQLSALMNKSMVNSIPKLIFIVGGPFGISEPVANRANLTISFSKLTLTHQMIRLFLLEQIYRAMTILNNERYHHS